jgi:hypothetical protein
MLLYGVSHLTFWRMSMKVKPETLERMSLAMRAVMNKYYTKECLQNVTVRELHNWWFRAFQFATYHPEGIPAGEIPFHRDETLPLYPDDTNDATLLTALKKVRDMILATHDDFVIVCFPNLTKDLCGVSFYKFNHSKAFIYFYGIEVEVPREKLNSRDPFVLAQIALQWQTMASQKDLSSHPKQPLEVTYCAPRPHFATGVGHE